MVDLKDLEVVRNIKRDLVRMRKEIDAMPNVEEKSATLKAYAELLTSLEIGTLVNLKPREGRIS
ncbi:MAG: hypothetical protein OEX77_02300 [Candidatus Bathyarchaeota archaeon]|nr:hypothetical protein [Candidatus Bathyarchaeota archaeon]MDH5733212.1 hypothetical protein [Candidatus Bathyarchaeota archaeon]